MTQTQQIITIAVVALGTILTRFLPFWLFPVNRHTPKYIQYLGRFLPAAARGLLVVYCLKDVEVLVSPYGLPELIAIGCIVLLHVWRRNMLLSIAGGTVVYMLLHYCVF